MTPQASAPPTPTATPPALRAAGPAQSLRATGTVTDGAVEQRAAQDIAGFGKLRQKPVAFADDPF